jgi:hypothetical protein
MQTCQPHAEVSNAALTVDTTPIASSPTTTNIEDTSPSEGLRRSTNPFTVIDKSTLNEESKFRRSAQFVLNRLTVQNRDIMLKEMLEIGALDHRSLRACVDIIFDKALQEKLFCDEYAKFFFQLFAAEDEVHQQSTLYDASASGPTLRATLIEKVESMSSKEVYENLFHHHNQMNPRRFLEVLSFIGSLLAQDVVSWEIFNRIMLDLAPADSPIDTLSDFNLECVVRLVQQSANTLVVLYQSGALSDPSMAVHVQASFTTLNDFLDRMGEVVSGGLSARPEHMSTRLFYLLSNISDELSFVRKASSS